MGIPKYYRWISERYPCLSEKIKDYQIPEFDNLYLDMNGIIHACSHPNDEDIHLRIPEDAIFRAIFNYIDFLFKMIKPQKVFFMAVDGVAPRAKMNQQRGRRFRSARLAEEQEADAIRKGEVLPEEERFDSNCITPGTEFMAKLQEHLKYFVQVKVSTDCLWQQEGLKIYLSGHDVPGEGEHKVMDFIRHIRSKPDYNPETRHCLYGLDADLIMLGLSTHELRFSLLREEVKFSSQRKEKRPKKKIAAEPPESQNTYNLGNISLFNSKETPTANVGSAESEQISDAPPASLTGGLSFSDVLKSEVGGNKDIPVEQNFETEKTLLSSDSNAKGNYRAPLPNKLTFYLLHLSLLRDYIDEEFQPLKRDLENHATMTYDLEKVIDDWILMSILVGNDFVPHLPNLHITKGALPMLYRTYMRQIPKLSGYLNENGVLNLPRFEEFVKALSQFDLEVFRETYDDMQYMESKTGKNIVLGERMFEDFEFEGNDFQEDALEPLSPELQALVARTNTSVFGENQSEQTACSGVFSGDDDYFGAEDSSEMRLEFFHHKRDYYITKLDAKEVTREMLNNLAVEYVRAVQWVLLYYYKGVSSWGWFYPSHYAPYSSDLRKFKDVNIVFEMGQPFKPFEQLLGVLPAQSKKLLPVCYQWLMTDEKSPIFDFYPEKFTQDLNGKKQDWEAVVLIPFIDEAKLLEAMEAVSRLNEEERQRNARGVMLCYGYTKEKSGSIIPPTPSFPALPSSTVKVVTLYDLPYDAALLPKGLHPRAKIDTVYQGFPTLKSISHMSSLEKAEVKIFEFLSREESLIIDMENHIMEHLDGKSLAKALIEKPIWVNWPHLTLVLITSVATKEGKFLKDRDYIFTDPEFNEKSFNLMAKVLLERHLKCKGIRLADLKIIIYAKMMEGRKIRLDSRGKIEFDIQWSKTEQPYAIQTALNEDNIRDVILKNTHTAKSYIDLFPIGDQVFSIAENEFGNVGVVKGYEEKTASVVVEFAKSSYDDDEENLKNAAGIGKLDSQMFYPAYRAATQCQISPYVLGRLTGSLFIAVEKDRKSKKGSPKKVKISATDTTVELKNPDSSSDESIDDFPPLQEKKKNVGLDLKFNKKNLEVRGYTKKKDQSWLYSSKAIQLVNEYVSKFSEFVQYMSNMDKTKESLHASEIFSEQPSAKIDQMIDWLEDRGVRDLQRIPMNTNILDDDDIDRVWKYVSQHKTHDVIGRHKVVIQSRLIFKATLNRGCVDPIPGTRFDILDRIVCVDRGAAMTMGTRGTVVGIHVPDTNASNTNEDAFKSTSSINLHTLFVLCDPTPDVFDKFYVDTLCDSGNKSGISRKDAEQMSSDLATLLRINIDEREDNNCRDPGHKPRIVSLYPFQVINLSKNIFKKSRVNNSRQNHTSVPNNSNARVSSDTQRTTNTNTTIKNPFVQMLPRNAPVNENVRVQPDKQINEKFGNPNKPIPPFNKKSNVKSTSGKEIEQRKATATSSKGSTCESGTIKILQNPNRVQNKVSHPTKAAFIPVIKQNITQHPFPSAQIIRPHLPSQNLLLQLNANASSSPRPFNLVTEANPFDVFMRPLAAQVIQPPPQPIFTHNKVPNVTPFPLFMPLPQRHPQFPSNYNSREKPQVVSQPRPPAPPVNWVAPTAQQVAPHHQPRPLPQRHTVGYQAYNRGFVPLQVDRKLASDSKSNQKTENMQTQRVPPVAAVQSQSQPGLLLNVSQSPVVQPIGSVKPSTGPPKSRLAANFSNFNGY